MDKAWAGEAFWKRWKLCFCTKNKKHLSSHLLHKEDQLSGVIKRLPTDGTFDQLNPLDRLVGEQQKSCFDFQSATDSWPLVLLLEIMCYLHEITGGRSPLPH